ncbi:hypothetical protein [Tunturiibacter gelidiferens]|uniref:Uncharacterized protein n=1 Tax=Tunturiibacter gelidiferens TaxID=3069689 RepID=A0AAU7Z609_9BACT
MPSAAARFVRKNRETSDWILAPLKSLVPLTLDSSEVTRLYGTNAELTDEDIAELRCELPAVLDLPTPEDFQALVNESASLADIDNHPLLRFRIKDDREGLVASLKAIVPRVATVNSILTANPEPWSEVCILAGIRGEASQRVWRMLTSFAQEVRGFSVTLETDMVLASGPPVAAPGIGTTTAVDKVMLPLLLELNGHLDILDINIESDPLEPHNVIVQYSPRRPAARNIFSATTDGLEPASRSLLNETELVLYCRLHRRLQECLVFGGRSKLEISFGQCCSWLIRKTAYCLEEPSFLSNPARDWLKLQNADSTIQMEDRFFLPAIYERLRSDFGSKVVKKPERFGGEIDILFDDTIPIELKVRRGRKGPLNLAEIDQAFPPAGQASA